MVFQIVVEASCIDVVDSLLEVNICNFWFLKQDVNRLPTIYNRSPLTRCLFQDDAEFREMRPGCLGRGPFAGGGKVTFSTERDQVKDPT